MNLKDFGNIPFRLSALGAVFPEISNLPWKAKRLETNGDIIRLKRGLYVVSPRESEMMLNDFLIANHIYGPSYVSMQTALRFYGLIPEAVYTTISLTIGLSKSYINPIGTFEYIHCPENYFPIGITTVSDHKISYLIATPEKALCDLVIFTPNLNLRYESEIRVWLEDELRMEMDSLIKFDIDILRQCAAEGRKKSVINHIINIIENERNF